MCLELLKLLVAERVSFSAGVPTIWQVLHHYTLLCFSRFYHLRLRMAPLLFVVILLVLWLYNLLIYARIVDIAFYLFAIPIHITAPLLIMFAVCC
jgi:hypothetical protein